MLNGSESDFFNKTLTGTAKVSDALVAYNKQHLISWVYQQYSEF